PCQLQRLHRLRLPRRPPPSLAKTPALPLAQPPSSPRRPAVLSDPPRVARMSWRRCRRRHQQSRAARRARRNGCANDGSSTTLQLFEPPEQLVPPRKDAGDPRKVPSARGLLGELREKMREGGDAAL